MTLTKPQKISSLFAHLSYSPARLAVPKSQAIPTSLRIQSIKMQKVKIKEEEEEDQTLYESSDPADRSNAMNIKREDQDIGSRSSSLTPAPSESVSRESSRAASPDLKTKNRRISLKRKPSSSTSLPGSAIKKDEEPVVPLEIIKPKKKKNITRKYADPSVYEHLKPISDYISEGNDVLFCGINPGLSSAREGHHYRGSTNRFWQCLSQSGLTKDTVTYADDHRLPGDYNIGITNLTSRATASASELSVQKDMRAGAPALLHKIQRFRPSVVCFVGKEIWREFEFMLNLGHLAQNRRSHKAGKTKETKGKRGAQKKQEGWELGPREWKVVHPAIEVDGIPKEKKETFFWVVSSTSGLVRDSMETRLKSWHALTDFVLSLKSGVFPIEFETSPDTPPGKSGEAKLRTYKVVDVEGVEAEVEKMWARIREKEKADKSKREKEKKESDE
ncbi:G/T mismatch-specific thymine DNA glycosylase [Phaffia rhodozyma]|uniref:G/T mismatch-specific thymine DNA glycosylase n=1 Tax=Phaffia rhodozyma TaxID=264483 RepID=A0A0F7SV30_PHARH|nr:G/T mismatch-specific thymine DNA glycosylase [Phaffia rhodozyma]